MIKVERLNIGMPVSRELSGKDFTTGIMKQPVSGPLRLTRLGFEGDGVGDLKHHGGTDKAVCVYGVEQAAYWAGRLGRDLGAAPFGENLSVTGMSESEISIGDTFRLGSATVQVSQPRQPCRTLAARHGIADFVKQVVESGRTGFYLRVLTEGEVRAGDMLDLTERHPLGVTVDFANRILHRDRNDRAGIERVLAVDALSASWRESFNKLLSAL